MRLREQVGRCAPVVLAAGPEAGTLKQHHQRDAVTQRQLREPVALGVGAGPMLPASVVKSSAPTITGEPSMRPEPATIPSAAIVAADEGAELTEGARVEQVVEARAGVELALAVVLGQPLRTAHRP